MSNKWNPLPEGDEHVSCRYSINEARALFDNERLLREKDNTAGVASVQNRKEIWMPHSGHFICGPNCRFHLNTYVNGYIVSTVGEYVPDSQVRAILRQSRGRVSNLSGDAEEAEYGFEQIGYDRLYETMVFKAKRSNHKCCPWQMRDPRNLDFEGYNDAGEAYGGHLKMVREWSKK